MKIISITGAASSAGKTHIACTLIRHLPGFASLKITRCSGGSCPRGKSCNVCNSFSGDFHIEENKKIIMQPGTDTWRMYNAGASRVLWIKARPEALKRAVDACLSSLSGLPGIIVEGNSFLDVCKADVSIMVIEKTGFLKLKPSAARIKEKIDIFIIRDNNKLFFMDNEEFTGYNNKKINPIMKDDWINEIIRRL
ncbi:hypothetical protein HY745_08175 [Candidatus Desantisbacteria bacterium]|nr:hypothetical protein [Candidatus Desantisbacteria bacterium]